MCSGNIFTGDNFNLGWLEVHSWIFAEFFINLTIWQFPNPPQDQGRKFLSKHDKVVTRAAVVSFSETLRDFFLKIFVNILIQFLFWHFICQVEIKFYSRSERQIHNLSFPDQFSSFNFLTYSSGICTSNTSKSKINCDLKTSCFTHPLKFLCNLRVFLWKWQNANVCIKLLSKQIINQSDILSVI